MPSVSSAISAEELQAQISALLAQIKVLQAQLTQLQGTPAQWCYDFNNNLGVGSRGKAINALHTALGKDGFDIDQDEKSNSDFGESTASAISGFQQKYRDEILAPFKLSFGTGFAGKGTRVKLNQLYSCGVKPPPVCAYSCPQYSPPSPDWCKDGEIVYVEVSDICGCSRPPKCILPSTDNQPPVIHGISGPTTLKAKETGTWVIKAYDPENGPLTYSVIWGDETGTVTSPLSLLPPRRESQTATFTHSYSTAGTYTPTFTVNDNKSVSAKTSISVNVGGVVVSSITVLSPNGGEKWEVKKTLEIKFRIGENNNGYVDLLVFPEGSESSYVFNDFFNNQKLPAGEYKSIWTIPQNLSLGKYRVKVYLKTLPVEGIIIAQDSSDAPFSIVAAGTSTCSLKDCPLYSPPSDDFCKDGKRVYEKDECGCSRPPKCVIPTQNLVVLSPNGGENWKVGETHEIKWSSNQPTANSVQISVSDTRPDRTFSPMSNLVKSATIATASNNGSYSWTIPSSISGLTLNAGNVYKIGVSTSIGNVGIVTDSSDSTFSITAQ